MFPSNLSQNKAQKYLKEYPPLKSPAPYNVEVSVQQ